MTGNEGSRQYLSFCLGSELFAVDVLQVREILDVTPITRVPQMPEYMLGVINLRGSVVPIIDLRCKFGMEQAEKTANSCIVVMEVAFGHELVVVGALTDAVREVLDLTPDDIEPPPRLGMRLRSDYIRGMGKKDDRFIILLDVDKVFAGDELAFSAEEELAVATG